MCMCFKKECCLKVDEFHEFFFMFSRHTIQAKTIEISLVLFVLVAKSCLESYYSSYWILGYGIRNGNRMFFIHILFIIRLLFFVNCSNVEREKHKYEEISLFCETNSPYLKLLEKYELLVRRKKEEKEFEGKKKEGEREEESFHPVIRLLFHASNFASWRMSVTWINPEEAKKSVSCWESVSWFQSGKRNECEKTWCRIPKKKEYSYFLVI